MLNLLIFPLFMLTPALTQLAVPWRPRHGSSGSSLAIAGYLRISVHVLLKSYVATWAARAGVH